MGRKGGGRSGFMKAQRRHAAEDGEDAAAGEQAGQTNASAGEGALQALTPDPAPAQGTSSKASAFLLSTGSDGDESGSDAEEGAQARTSAGETRGQLTQRHKKEQKALKDQVKRLGKKGKDEGARLQADMDARHAKELAELEAAVPVPAPDSGLASLMLDEGQEDQPAPRQTKAARKKAQKAAKEAERDARIRAELEALGETEREQEEEALRAGLAPSGLTVHDVAPDGHCLYRSIEHQLEQAGQTGKTYLELRALAVEFMRAHPDDFRPYLAEDDVTGPIGENEDVFEAYCREMESTAAWGGHLELEALSQALRLPITVHAAAAKPQQLGTNFQEPALEICYFQHAYGLGEHYNSTVALPKAEQPQDDA